MISFLILVICNRTCIRNYIENGFISNGQCFFTCLNPTCKYEYSTALMGDLLAPTLFSRLIIKIQQEELRLANIPNFEQCKYCTFGTSMTRFSFQIIVPSFLLLHFIPMHLIEDMRIF